MISTPGWLLGAGSLRSHSAATRLNQVEGALRRVAAGDLAVEIGDSGTDQVARLSEAAGAVVSAMRSVLQEVGSIRAAIHLQREEIAAIGDYLSTSAETTVTDTLAARAAAAGVSENMHVVASANEELATTIAEIAAAAAAAVTIAHAAAEHAGEASSTAEQLAGEAEQLGTISTLINDLARQTRLLALNARIEASRESSDQSGFVVVASEVKELASHSADATGQVRERVTRIRAGTAGVNSAMHVLTGDLGQVADRQNAIASSVQQQLTATQEISNVAAISAVGSREITESIQRISLVMRRIAYGGSQARNSASELADLEQRLRGLTDAFTVGTTGPDSPATDVVAARAFVRDDVTVVKNNVIGTGTNELEYVGDWCHSDANELSGDSDAYGSMPGDTVTLRFSGTYVSFFGVTDAHHGMAAIAIDGGAESEVDEYSAERLTGVPLWESGQLAPGAHVLTVRVLDRKNPASRYYWVTIDRLEVR